MKFHPYHFRNKKAVLTLASHSAGVPITRGQNRQGRALQSAAKLGSSNADDNACARGCALAEESSPVPASTVDDDRVTWIDKAIVLIGLGSFFIFLFFLMKLAMLAHQIDASSRHLP